MMDVNNYITINFRDIFPLYRVSYMWYTALGALITILMSGACGCVFGSNDPRKVDPTLLAPSIRNFFGYTENKFNTKVLLAKSH